MFDCSNSWVERPQGMAHNHVQLYDHSMMQLIIQQQVQRMQNK